MATGPISRAIDQFRDVILAEEHRGLSDQQLLDLFVVRRDEEAFAALVRRHGPMVLGVCRRVVGNWHDAEDAFQATFLVLAKKASSLSDRERTGSWLHGVARRTALKARAAAARRLREQQAGELVGPQDDPALDRDDLLAVLDEELSRLPEMYRLPVVLCELEGRPRREVAGQLAIPEGTLSSRLAAARRLLARCLGRRGLTLSGAALAAVLTRGVAAAHVPALLVRSTVKTVMVDLLAGTVPVGVVALAEGGMRTMYLSKIKVVATVFLALVCSGVAVGMLAARGYGGQAEAPPKPPVARPENPAEPWADLMKPIDPDKHTVGKGIWRLKEGKLTAYPAGHGARLRIPVVPKGDYELLARWEPKEADSSVAFIVPHGDRMASVEVLTSMGRAGLGDLNGVRPDINETKTEVRVKPGKVYDVAIRVTVDGASVHVLAKLDKETIVDWKGKRSELEHAFFAPPKPASLGLGVGGNVSVFHSLKLRMLKGSTEAWKPDARAAEGR